MKDPKKSQRLDDLMMACGLASDRKEAAALVMAKKVIVDDQRAPFASIKVAANAQIRLKGQGLFISRGGDKLASAINHFGLQKDFAATRVLDVGASTGGFTDCCLQYGAQEVVAVDVGTNQLAWRLRQEPRVTCIEQTDIREFAQSPQGSFDWLVCDVSFIKLATILPALKILAQPGASRCLLLVKPQFEVADVKVPPGGVIQDQADQNQALDTVLSILADYGWRWQTPFASTVKGRKGNQEFFVLCEANQ